MEEAGAPGSSGSRNFSGGLSQGPLGGLNPPKCLSAHPKNIEGGTHTQRIECNQKLLVMTTRGEKKKKKLFFLPLFFWGG